MQSHSHSRENSSRGLSSLGVPTAAVLMAIAIGSAAPTFECQSHTGATLKLADYAGKKLLIWFYPRACTGG
jgi:hypothetical protein